MVFKVLGGVHIVVLNPCSAPTGIAVRLVTVRAHCLPFHILVRTECAVDINPATGRRTAALAFPNSLAYIAFLFPEGG
ncbi:hypothetical protein GCM10023352_15600 [Rothia endophytica]|uniref:Secreted protein n=1 Tax=Rothia endophytica TaxID=1324766 RepID=A0ABP9BKF6_9MICC